MHTRDHARNTLTFGFTNFYLLTLKYIHIYIQYNIYIRVMPYQVRSI